MLLQSPINTHTQWQYQSAVPANADVVVIGAGIAGISAALSLAEAGVKVVVCEKGRVGGEQSSRNWGWVRQTGRDAAEYPIMVESLRLWKEMAARTGENCLAFSEQGVLYVSEDESAAEKYQQSVELAKLNGVESHILSGDEIRQRVPHGNSKWCVGLYTKSDGRVEPWSAVPALARAVTRAGGLVIENCAVRAIETAAGEVAEVVTEHGVIRTNRVLLAGGAWSSLLARHVGVSLPQLSVKATVARFEATAELYDGNIKDNGLAVCKRPDGGYNMALTDYQKHFIGPSSFRFFKPFMSAMKASLADTRFGIAPGDYPDSWTGGRWKSDQQTPFERNRVLDPQAETSVVERMTERLRTRFSSAGEFTVTHAWAGMIETTPDFVPVLDHCPELPGLTIATGFSGHGFGIGPAAGQIMANLIQGQSSPHDLTRFHLSRFTDPTPLTLGPL